MSNYLRKIKRKDERTQKTLDRKEREEQYEILKAEREKEEKENPKPKMSKTDSQLTMAAMLGLSNSLAPKIFSK